MSLLEAVVLAQQQVEQLDRRITETTRRVEQVIQETHSIQAESHRLHQSTNLHMKQLLLWRSRAADRMSTLATKRSVPCPPATAPATQRKMGAAKSEAKLLLC